MSRNKIIFILGLLLILIPFSGFPSAWKFYFYEASGIILVLLALRNYWLQHEIARRRGEDFLHG